MGAHYAMNGYSTESYTREAFRAAVKKLAEVLPHLMKRTGATVVAVRGKSGVSMAYALAMLIDIDIVIVRKPDENSHGARVEGWGGNVEKYIILDDFISSGRTCLEIIRILSSLEDTQGNNAGMECVGMLMYQGCTSEYQQLRCERFAREAGGLTSLVDGNAAEKLAKIPVWKF